MLNNKLLFFVIILFSLVNICLLNTADKATMNETCSELIKGIKAREEKNYQEAVTSFINCFNSGQNSLFKALAAKLLKTLKTENRIPDSLKKDVDGILIADKAIEYYFLPEKS
jgi:intergrase/recombinase